MEDPRKVGAVLVVGAGIGGMQASLDLANAGFKVYLAEKDPANAAEVEGFVGNFRTVIKQNGTGAEVEHGTVILSKPDYVPEAIIFSVDEEVCAGCGICASICSFEAAEIVTVRGKSFSRINRALCKGCGACASACPSGAAQQLGFRPRQIDAMIAAAVAQ